MVGHVDAEPQGDTVVDTSNEAIGNQWDPNPKSRAKARVVIEIEVARKRIVRVDTRPTENEVGFQLDRIMRVIAGLLDDRFCATRP